MAVRLASYNKLLVYRYTYLSHDYELVDVITSEFNNNKSQVGTILSLRGMLLMIN